MANVFLARPTGKFLVCVLWRFCRAGRTRGEAAGCKIRREAAERAAKLREKVAPAPNLLAVSLLSPAFIT